MTAQPVYRDEFPVLRTVSTRWHDEDAYGHINNVVYYAFFDTAVNAHLMSATGTDTRRLASIGVVVESGCEFRRELRFPDDVEVGISVTKLGTSSIAYRLALFQGTAPEAAAVGRFVHVYVDATTRAVAVIPDVVRNVAASLTVPATGGV